MAGLREHDERGGWDAALHEERRLQARLVLVAGHDQGWDLELREAILERVDRGPSHLHPAHRERVAFGRARAETVSKFLPADGILLEKLDARGSARVEVTGLLHAVGLEPPSHQLTVGAIGLGIVAAVARARDDER